MIKLRRVRMIFFAALFLYAALFSLNHYVSQTSEPYIYSDLNKVPTKQAALLLGTTKYLKGGYTNYFYTYRIEAAAKLFKAGKVKAIIVSGDNSTERYDEPTSMYEDLIKMGVPQQYITLDYAGFRTIDSVIRAEAIFDLDDYIIVSQAFHLERAVYLSHAKKQKTVGFIAKDIPGTTGAYRMKYREYLARAKAFLDLYIIHKEPKFYGEKVEVQYKV